jgi:paired small multidrug resistance pump
LKNWSFVFIAVFFEILWVIGLKHADNAWEWAVTIFGYLISFYYLVIAGKNLPVGTVYAVFVGLGTAGTVLSELIFFAEPMKISKLIFISILLSGVIGLKLVTKEDDKNEQKEAAS